MRCLPAYLASYRNRTAGKHRCSWRSQNSPGSLNRALGVFALAGIDLSKIESRPIAGKPWEYAFYIDVVCNAADESITRAFGQLRTNADSLEVLGSYPTSW